MQYYFPYSQIISETTEVKTIRRHAYVGDWQVSESETRETAKPKASAISEIYY
ncbi:MAG: hypothetical protein NC336_07210 [Clostridium sp.]|nr:hypothetical protein [Clostridium sp.]